MGEAAVIGEAMRISIAADLLTEIGHRVRSDGMLHVATHVHAAARHLRTAALRLDRFRDPGTSNEEGSEVLRTTHGERLGASLVPIGDGVGRVERLPVVPPSVGGSPPDLAWEMIADDRMRDFAADDLAASLLARALAQTGWADPARGARWATSAMGAQTIVRLLRRGRTFPRLAAGQLIDADVLTMLVSLGWSPDRRR